MDEIRIKINTSNLKERLQDWIDANPKLKPVEVGSDSEFAFPTEFGSDGVVGTEHKGGGKKGKNPETTEMQNRLRKEIAKNYGLSGPKLNEMTKKVYRSRVAFGQIPDPFLRPALHQVIGEILRDRTWLSTHSTLDLADRIEGRMKRILQENRTLFAEDIERHMFSGYAGETGRHGHSMDKVSPEAMNNDYSKADGSAYNGHKGLQEGRL